MNAPTLAPVSAFPLVGGELRMVRELCNAIMAVYFDLRRTDYTPSTTNDMETQR